MLYSDNLAVSQCVSHIILLFNTKPWFPPKLTIRWTKIIGPLCSKLGAHHKHILRTQYRHHEDTTATTRTTTVSHEQALDHVFFHVRCHGGIRRSASEWFTHDAVKNLGGQMRHGGCGARNHPAHSLSDARYVTLRPSLVYAMQCIRVDS
jgi:hypothetical protein